MFAISTNNSILRYGRSFRFIVTLCVLWLEDTTSALSINPISTGMILELRCGELQAAGHSSGGYKVADFEIHGMGAGNLEELLQALIDPFRWSLGWIIGGTVYPWQSALAPAHLQECRLHE